MDHREAPSVGSASERALDHRAVVIFIGDLLPTDLATLGVRRRHPSVASGEVMDLVPDKTLDRAPAERARRAVFRAHRVARTARIRVEPLERGADEAA